MYFPFTTAKNLAGFGPEHALLMSDFKKLQQIFMLAADEALPEDRIAIDRNGDPKVHYRFSDRVLNAFVKAQRVAAESFFEAGAERVHAPAAAKFLIERADRDRLDQLIQRRHLKLGKVAIAAAHMMGGCRMGTSPEESVTDTWGRVHDIPWLFLADSSLFPKSSEVFPNLTVMSLADRVAQRIRQDAANLLALSWRPYWTAKSRLRNRSLESPTAPGPGCRSEPTRPTPPDRQR